MFAACCLSAPKYGNDDDMADDIATRLFHRCCRPYHGGRQAAGLDHYNIVSVNNSMSAEWGNFCAASATAAERPAAPWQTPTALPSARIECGITALLNSMSKFDNTKHVGVINNVRFTKELFKGSMDEVEAVLKAFYDNDGVQTNLCVIGKDDLENAMVHRKTTRACLVRIGGFSARFVTLNPIVQRGIIERTTYGASAEADMRDLIFDIQRILRV
ncbi:glycine radical domain-containing protein [Hominenteromicrobium sp.]|uniref:glycine radical domain-containing protein n=1 Tax=Hominenteromicrobium sp. TaxID=3073581 RepID=UPI00399BDA74